MATTPCSASTPAAIPTPGSAAEELQLLRQVAAREPQAFDTLYQRYAPSLRRFLSHRLPHPDLLDEVCHDVLLVAWQQAASFQATARLSTWLCGIAQHRAQKAWQRVARQRAAPCPLSPTGDTAADPAVLLLHQEQQQVLARAVAQLPSDLRVVVEAAYDQAASYEAIASRLGCPVGTVQARLVRARRRLRVALIREGRYPAPCDAAHRQLVTMRTPAPRPAGNSEGVYSIEASDDHGGRTGPVREGPGPAVRSRVVNGG
jgi:RNA polymerase sigma-70 factor (ECF subfamily)